MTTTDTRVLTSLADASSCFVLFEDKGAITYEGRASSMKALTSEPVWQIKKTTTSGFIKSVQYANHGRQNCTWDARESYFSSIVLPFQNAWSTSFDGSNDYVDLTNASLPDTNGPFSYACWARTSVLGARTFVSQGLSTSTTKYAYLYLTSGVFKFSLNGAMVVSHPTIVEVDKWYHVVGCRSGNTSWIALNGVIGATLTDTAGDCTTNVAAIGALRRAGGAYFHSGFLDEVSIWNCALTTEQISELYNGGVASNVLNHSAALTNLKAYYRMGDDGDVFPYVYDKKGANHGFMSNMISSNFALVVPP